jgi:hypothetical protein
VLEGQVADAAASFFVNFCFGMEHIPEHMLEILWLWGLLGSFRHGMSSFFESLGYMQVQ